MNLQFPTRSDADICVHVNQVQFNLPCSQMTTPFQCIADSNGNTNLCAIGNYPQTPIMAGFIDAVTNEPYEVESQFWGQRPNDR